MAFRSRADDGPFKLTFGCSIPSSTPKKKVIKFGPPLSKLSGSAHDNDRKPENAYAILLKTGFASIINTNIFCIGGKNENNIR